MLCLNTQFNKTMIDEKIIFPNDLQVLVDEFNDSKITQEEFFSKLDDIDCYQTHYLKARVYLNKQDLLNAMIEINISIHLIEEYDENDLRCGLGTFFPALQAYVYRTAGEIFAISGNQDKATEFYIKSQYYSIQLKSDFDDIQSGIVYSFRRVSVYSLSDLISNTITVCHPSKMNDPFDSLFLLWSSESNLNKICKDKAHIKPFSDSFQYFKIRSFVGNKNLIANNNLIRKVVMWSHYADAHKGFCIRYKLSTAFIKQEYGNGYSHKYLKRVHYRPKNEKCDILTKNTDTNSLFIWKSTEWRYENEIRLISYEPNCKDDHLQIPLDENSKIEAIYFGYRCVASNIKDIMQILGKEVQYFKMDYDPNNVYKLKVNRIFYKDYIDI